MITNMPKKRIFSGSKIVGGKTMTYTGSSDGILLLSSSHQNPDDPRNPRSANNSDPSLTSSPCFFVKTDLISISETSSEIIDLWRKILFEKER